MARESAYWSIDVVLAWVADTLKALSKLFDLCLDDQASHDSKTKTGR